MGKRVSCLVPMLVTAALGSIVACASTSGLAGGAGDASTDVSGGEPDASQDDMDGAFTDAGSDVAVAADAGASKETGAMDAAVVDADADAGFVAPPAVYVVADSNVLYRFDTTTHAFTQIGAIACVPKSSVSGIAVDRAGTAWVVLLTPASIGGDQASIWQVRTTDASCISGKDVSAAPSGLAFGRDTSTSSTETLFAAVTGGSVDAGAGVWLAIVDRQTLKYSAVGPLVTDMSSNNVALAGGPDGSLLALNTPNPFEATGDNDYPLSSRAKTDAAGSPLGAVTMSQQLNRGMALWVGDLWIFSIPSSMGTPAVGRYTLATNTFSVVVPNMGFTPVAAASPTSAP